MRQILVVDNDLAVCQTIQGRLQNDVTEVCCISSLVEALSSYIRQDYRLPNRSHRQDISMRTKRLSFHRFVKLTALFLFAGTV